MTIENINIKPSYEEQEAEKVLETLPIFSSEVKKFLDIINNM